MKAKNRGKVKGKRIPTTQPRRYFIISYDYLHDGRSGTGYTGFITGTNFPFRSKVEEAVHKKLPGAELVFRNFFEFKNQQDYNDFWFGK